MWVERGERHDEAPTNTRLRKALGVRREVALLYNCTTMNRRHPAMQMWGKMVYFAAGRVNPQVGEKEAKANGTSKKLEVRGISVNLEEVSHGRF